MRACGPSRWTRGAKAVCSKATTKNSYHEDEETSELGFCPHLIDRANLCLKLTKQQYSFKTVFELFKDDGRNKLLMAYA